METFQVGQTYECVSVCDSNCVWFFTIAKRTAKTVTTTDGKTFRLNSGLTYLNQAETILPLGRYSMAPILTANKKAA